MTGTLAARAKAASVSCRRASDDGAHVSRQRARDVADRIRVAELEVLGRQRDRHHAQPVRGRLGREAGAHRGPSSTQASDSPASAFDQPSGSLFIRAASSSNSASEMHVRSPTRSRSVGQFVVVAQLVMGKRWRRVSRRSFLT
jgi:hypothetical protein